MVQYEPLGWCESCAQYKLVPFTQDSGTGCERPQLGIDLNTKKAVINCWTRKVSVPLKEKVKFTRQIKI